MRSDSRRILDLARPELGTLAIGTVALVIGSAMQLLYPMKVQEIIDGISGGGGQDVVNRATAELLVLFLAGSLLGGVRAWLFTVAGERVVTRLRKDLYNTVIGQEIAFFDERRTGELTSRLASDTTVLQNTVTVNVSMLLRFALLAIGAVGFLFYTSWKLSLVTLAVVPVIAIGAGLTGRLLRKSAREVQDALARTTEVAEETIAGVRTVRAFAREDAERARYAAAVDHSFDLSRKRAGILALFRGGVGFLGYAAIALILYMGGRMLIAQEITLGELTSFLLYTMTVGFSMGALSSLYEDFMKALGASDRVFDLMERAPGVRSGERRLAAVEGQVRLEGVAFSYPSRPDVVVLDGVDLSLRPGEVVALVGPSGGGKSTIAQLLSRFYDPSAGRLLLDGVPYGELHPDWLREQVGVVSQEPILFATTIGENIRYGRPAATDAEVEAAARAANAHDFISAFPQGYGTMVGERGVKLSGGQKQRVAIARAILKDPRVLVLDEATSALDAESEHLVQEALDRLMKGRTTLVIAHRLSTVRDADRVVVLEGGKVAEQGTHEQLLAQAGLYKKLVERQFAA